MLGDLQEKLRNVIRKIEGTAHFDEEKLEEVLKEIQRALILADVSPELTFGFIEHIKKRIKEEKGLRFTKREQFLYLIYDELTKIVGTGKTIEIKEKPFKILLVGLFGSGKTTTSAKLAKYFKKRGYKVALLGLDTFRPAAMDQIEQLGRKIQVPTFVAKDEKDPVNVIKRFEDKFNKYDIIIADSAGRDALDKELAKEIKSIKRELQPQESILVIPADIGQSAKEQAKSFKKLVNVKNVIITRMDGTAKGGGALTACYEAESPILFLGTGEKIDELEEFEPKSFIGQLLGLGDIKTLLKKAEEAFTLEEAQKASEKFFRGKFNLIDFYNQIKGIKKMGSLSKIMNLIPGMGLAGIPPELISMQESKLERYEHIMQSMTFEELKNPDIISGTRVQRIAFGAGTSEEEVRELIKGFKQINKLSKRINPRKLKGLEKNFNIKNLKGMF